MEIIELRDGQAIMLELKDGKVALCRERDVMKIFPIVENS